ncbi:phycobilisome degradation protein NblB [Chroogloeocystis siderophila]|jgi:HEAT repeat protein|uniref:Phycocyanin alpha phycocyanobilin lyase n=1 Tax=Chroogloeocystis siderophila 5.2 s.c.1 TaxID=247279 RepID=A0A1U7HXK9_9CHRO|nr:HEAT repeat domain-containing protein [Chroogloeocystis siderophila]OKH28353.1 phycocyanin alpha phycocyanobilin lyase [Chroogloeocystis siderophila 5.2 s.c.1]
MSVAPETVKQMLSSEDLGERLRAVNQIRELEDTALAFELAQSAVQDPNARVRYSAVSQMDTLGGQNLQVTLDLLRDRLKNDPEPDVQAAAADCIGALKLTEAYTDLEQLYHSTSEWLIKFSIVATLGELGDPRSFDLLQEALNSDIDLVKTAAISSLGDLKDARAVELLVPHVSNADWQVRYRAAQALGKLGGTQAQSILKEMVNDEVEAVAQEAKTALEQMG